MPKKVYYATLYRFGYDLDVISDTKEHAVDAIMTEYKKAYYERNEDDEDAMNDFEIYYKNAITDIEIIEMELNKVEWR